MLKCLERLKNSRTEHSLIYLKMIKESPIIAAKTDITTLTNVFDRRIIVKFPPRKLWMNQAENMTLSDEIHATQMVHSMTTDLVMEFFRIL
jgi:hypothetical protein